MKSDFDDEKWNYQGKILVGAYSNKIEENWINWLRKPKRKTKENLESGKMAKESEWLREFFNGKLSSTFVLHLSLQSWFTTKMPRRWSDDRFYAKFVEYF